MWTVVFALVACALDVALYMSWRQRRRAYDEVNSLSACIRVQSASLANANKLRDDAEAKSAAAQKSIATLRNELSAAIVRAKGMENELDSKSATLRMFGDLGPVREELEAYKRCFGQLTKDDVAKRVSVVDSMTKRQNELVADLQAMTALLEKRTVEADEFRFKAGWAQTQREVAEAKLVLQTERVRQLEADTGPAAVSVPPFFEQKDAKHMSLVDGVVTYDPDKWPAKNTTQSNKKTRKAKR